MANNKIVMANADRPKLSYEDDNISASIKSEDEEIDIYEFKSLCASLAMMLGFTQQSVNKAFFDSTVETSVEISNKINEEFSSFLDDEFDDLTHYVETGEKVLSDDDAQEGFNIGYLRGLEVARRIADNSKYDED